MKRVVETPDAPNALGPYSQAIRCGTLLFLSGQIGLDPATGAMVDGDAGAQAERCMRNLGAVLAAESLGFENLIKTTIYLEHGDFFVRDGDDETVYVWFKLQKRARAIDRKTGKPSGEPIKIPETETVHYIAEHVLR